jgi:hypothetical protein
LSRTLLNTSLAQGPSFERRRGELGKELIPVDAQDLLHEPTVRGEAVHAIGDAEAGPSHSPCPIRIGEELISEFGSFLSGLHRLVTVNQAGEVQLKLMAFPGSVRALYLTELALEASPHDVCRLGGCDPTDVSFVFVVQEAEKHREAVTELEAHSAAVTDLESPHHLFCEGLRLPVPLLVWIVTQPVGRRVGDRFLIRAHEGLRSSELVKKGEERADRQ